MGIKYFLKKGRSELRPMYTKEKYFKNLGSWR